MGPDPAIFRALIERSPMVTYLADAEGAITYISAQITEWTGHPVHRWIEDPAFWLTLIHPDDRERVTAAAAGNAMLDIEYRICGRDGAWLWIWEREVAVVGAGTQGVCFDVTALHETRAALDAARARLADVVNVAPVILFATDPEGTITLSEGKALERLGLVPGEMVGTSIFDYSDLPELSEHAHRALSGESFQNRLQIIDGTFDCSWHGLANGSMTGIAIDVTAWQQSEKRLAHLAYHDPLTGLPNRSNVENQLGRELLSAVRDGVTIAALYIDLDQFKLVNDSLGHSAGDQVLREVAARIRATTRAGDLLARLGGDEFMLLCPGLGPEAAEATAARILAALDPLLVIDGTEFRIGASIGIAMGPGDGDTAAEILKHADAAMYQAKRDGRDSFALFSDDAGNARRKLTLTARLRRALAEEQFVLHYQPVHELATGRLRGVEALVRWHDPECGLVPPGDFLPHAEETGLIVLIGEWVLESVCRQAAAWGELGLMPRMAFNASTRELRDDGYVARVVAALERHELQPGRMLIEVSEAAMDEYDRTRRVLEQLHELGVVLALDDFGTEHSSLSRLRELPVQVLKADGSFLRGVPGDADGAAIVRAIATLGAGLGMDVVAEGIETVEQLEFAAAAGCGFGQGYHFSRPLPAAQVTPLLTSSLVRSRRVDRAPARSRADSPR